MTDPAITVCIPHLTSRIDQLHRALGSVQAQTLPPVDVLVWPDNLNDGPSHVRNILLAMVNTPLVAFLDDDDEMLPDHLEQLHEALADPRNARASLAWSPPEVVGADYQASFIESAWLARTQALRQVGGWRRPVPGSWADYYTDYGLLLRMIMDGHTFVKVGTPTWRAHIHPGNTQGTKPFPGVSDDRQVRAPATDAQSPVLPS